MSDSVSDFFSKGNIRKFACKAKEYAEKHLVKAAAGLVLASAFASCSPSESNGNEDNERTPKTAYAITEKGDTLCSYSACAKDSASFARLQALVNNATKSKTGRSILKSMSKQGTVLVLDTANASTIGFFNPENNSITLNENFGNDYLQSCLIHEGKHSVQNKAMTTLPTYMYNFASNTIITRAMEADAVATQTKFAYEMMHQGDSTSWMELKEHHPGITREFETQALQHGIDSKQAMESTMLKWYDDIPYSTQYDISSINYYANASQKKSGAALRQMFSQNVNADSVITRICALDGVSYAGTDGSVLKTPRTFSITLDAYSATRTISSYQASKCGRGDNSVSGMYIVLSDGQRLDMTYAQAEAAADRNQKLKASALSYQLASKAYTGR